MDLRERTGTTTTRHPWETARAAFLIDAVDHLLQPDARVVDVGAGDAFIAAAVRARVSDVTCFDAGFSADDVARLSALGLRASTTAPAGPFDLALLLDVLEHVDDDRGFLGAVVDRVVGGGHVLISVPCWPRLFSAHDRALAHVRRYTPATCRALAHSAGLELVRSGGFFHGLLLPRAASVVVERVRGGGDDDGHGVGGWRGGALLSRAIHAALRTEQRVSVAAAEFGVDVPGLSFFALCRKPR